MTKGGYISFLIILLSTCAVKAQDSLLYLSKDEVLSIVKQYHPIISQAGLKVQRMDAGILTARGAFDPVASASGERKTFDGKQYYSYINPELKIPTWYGIQIKAGAEEIYGTRVNPERTLGKSTYAGVEVPVLKGLLFDERRATLRQAASFRDMSIAEQQLTVNNVMLEVLVNYWNWVQAYYTYRIYADVVKVNEQRIKMVKLEYEQGNRAAIDTVEALTQLQTYRLMESQAWVAFQNAGLELSTELWLENNTPFLWVDDIVPDSASMAERPLRDDIPPLLSLVTIAGDHPKLNVIDAKIDVLETERRLKAQQFLPQLDVSANLLNKGYEVPADISTPFLENNYKAGVEFKLPILYRKAVGGYREAKLKIQETELEQDFTTLEIENKVKAYYNEVLALYRQIILYEDAYYNFARMYRAELTRYEIGESTLFLINSRENKLLTAEQKLLELKTKWHKNYSALLWSAGVLRL